MSSQQLRRQALGGLRELYEPAPKHRAALGDDDGSKKSNQATKLVEELNHIAEFFHDGDDAYASFAVGSHRETHAITSKAFRQFAARHYYRRTGSVPNSENMTAALNVLAAQADADGAEHQVHLRTAEHDGRAYIDLGDPAWRVIEITADDWRIIAASECPVRFRRSKGTMALPTPEHDGDIRELRPFVNLEADQDAFLLLVCFMVAVLLGVGPYPILLVIAEHGGTKSTLLRILRALLDPSKLPIRSLPKEPRDFAIACENSLLNVYDNVSRLPQWLSDLMCTAATGGGFGVRTHYENREEELFTYCRPQAIAAIKECAPSPDFQDRAITINPPKLGKGKRRTESAFKADFQKAAPRILGALLDGASYALRNVNLIKVVDLPRMADFALRAAAAAPAFGWTAEQFLAVYLANTANADVGVLEASLVAPFLPCPWVGTATELLAYLNNQAPEQTRKSKFWPTDGRLLSNHLRTIAVNLRSTDMEITFEKPSHSRRLIAISKQCAEQQKEGSAAQEEEGLEV